MKYCSKCGNQMADDMLFCQKCGTRSVVENTDTQEAEKPKFEPAHTATINNYHSEPSVKNNTPKTRKGMKVGMIICFVFGAIYALISLAEPAIFGMTLFCAILGIMFFGLSKSPKDSVYMFGKDKGIKKSIFVLVCIIVAFVSFGALMSTMDTTTPSTSSVTTQTESNTPFTSVENKKVSMADIEKWYKNEMPIVSQNLIDYANGVKGISNINVTESKFRFGEQDGWYDCHYTYYFTCKVNGEKCMGEARAFRKYNDSNIDWFHFEITRDADWATIVEEYDESSDATIENYYKELVSQYK